MIPKGSHLLLLQPRVERFAGTVEQVGHLHARRVFECEVPCQRHRPELGLDGHTLLVLLNARSVWGSGTTQAWTRLRGYFHQADPRRSPEVHTNSQAANFQLELTNPQDHRGNGARRSPALRWQVSGARLAKCPAACTALPSATPGCLTTEPGEARAQWKRSGNQPQNNEAGEYC
eukprot:358380-Chlamydomonas_euryale.AAC.7